MTAALIALAILVVAQGAILTAWSYALLRLAHRVLREHPTAASPSSVSSTVARGRDSEDDQGETEVHGFRSDGGRQAVAYDADGHIYGADAVDLNGERPAHVTAAVWALWQEQRVLGHGQFIAAPGRPGA